MKKTLPYFMFSLSPLAAQEPYDLNQYGKGIIDAKGAEEIDKEWHAPIKLTLVVRDEEGKPVANAITNVGIDSRLHMDGHNNFKGKTDENGRFVVEARGGGSSDIVVVKEGYYRSLPDVEWNDKRNLDFENIKKIGFQPWNQTVDVMLKKIGAPIPMIVSLGLSTTDRIRYAPKLGEEVGFDLMECDWVAPHGRGQTGDLQVMFESDMKDPKNYITKVVFRFTNPDDGMIPIDKSIGSESLLKYPRSAPMDGYEVKSTMVEKQFGGLPQPTPQPTQNEPIGYFVRIRTVKEKDTGKILSANYGKIVNETGQGSNENLFKLVPYMWKDRKIDPTPGFQVSYYLNPTPNDRNLEYDQHNNLAPDANKGGTYPP